MQPLERVAIGEGDVLSPAGKVGSTGDTSFNALKTGRQIRAKDDVVQKQSERERQPYRVRLPGFVNEEGVGLGDLIKRATYSTGISPCGGCTRRAATLNCWVIFTR